MLNFKLIGVADEKRDELFAIIQYMLAAKSNYQDTLVSFMEADRRTIQRETICSYGFDEDAKGLISLCGSIPKGVGLHSVTAQVRNLKGEVCRYVEVHAKDLKMIDEIIEYMKNKGLRCGAEKREVFVWGEKYFLKTPCVKVVSDDVKHDEIINLVLSKLRMAGVGWSFRLIIPGFTTIGGEA